MSMFYENDVLVRMRSMKQALKDNNLIKAGAYRGRIIVEQRDSTLIPSPSVKSMQCDLLVTSPPYGDNVSTVPYGQSSFLPLQWIDFADIEYGVDENLLASTHEIDHRSLGGSRKGIKEVLENLYDLSETFGITLQQLETVPKDLQNKVTAFCRDLNRCIDPILFDLKPNAYMIWVVGNRNVGGVIIPTDDILLDFLVARNVRLVVRFQRKIPSKRMASRNNIATTMRAETILILRKGGNNA